MTKIVNNYLWVGKFDFDRVPDGPLTMLGLFASLVGVVIAACIPWSLWSLFIILSIVTVWSFVITVFRTNSVRRLSGYRKEAYLKYLELPKDIKKELPAMNFQTIRQFSMDDARSYHSALMRLHDEAVRQQQILNTPKYQHHMEETNLLVTRYNELNKELDS